MKHCLLALLLGVNPALAEPPRGSEPKVLEAFREDIIPHLDLEPPTFKQSIRLVRDHWSQKHAKDLFPVAVTVYPVDEHTHKFTKPEFDKPEPIHLHDIPCIEALRYFSGSVDAWLVDHGEILELAWPAPNRGWGVWHYPISERALSQLQVNSTSTREQLYAAFERIGVHVKPQGNAGFELKDAGKVIEVFCDWDEKDTIAAMIHLLDAGYKISK